MLTEISRERIRSRLLKSASQIWGVQATDINAFDPIVNMLFGAFSIEMEKAYNEIESSHSRVLERLAKLLAPQVNRGALPAHAVMHARSVEPRSMLSKNAQFFFQKRVPSKESAVRESFRSLYFTPVAPTLLFNGDITYSASDRLVFSHLDGLHKEKVLESRSGKRIPANTLWLGIDLSDKLETINGLSLYFDWLTSAEREYFLKFLSSTHFYLNGVPLEINIGLYANKQIAEGDFADPDIEFDPAKNAEQDIMGFYDDRFVTIKLPDSFKAGIHSLAARVPDELKQVFTEAEMQFVPKKLFWVKIVFPRSLSPDVVENIYCSINAFPAVNRQLNEFTYRLQPQFNILPFNTGSDHFFSVHSVKSSEGVPFNSSSIADTHKMGPGSYVVRCGGIERFDTRNAAEILTYMIELLRDESAAFAVYGRDAIASTLRELNQNLNVISLKLDKTADELNPVNYLVLKANNANEIVFVEFWSTAGEFGNNQKTGTHLSPVSGSNVNSEHLMLLSNTLGGRDHLSDGETLNYFKSALLSRNRIISEADINYVCQREMGHLMKDVEIKPGIEIDKNSKGGFIRTVEIIIHPANPMNPTLDEWQSLCKNLQVKLEKGSALMMPLRVKLNSN